MSWSAGILKWPRLGFLAQKCFEPKNLFPVGLASNVSCYQNIHKAWFLPPTVTTTMIVYAVVTWETQKIQQNQKIQDLRPQNFSLISLEKWLEIPLEGGLHPNLNFVPSNCFRSVSSISITRKRLWNSGSRRAPSTSSFPTYKQKTTAARE